MYDKYFKCISKFKLFYTILENLSSDKASLQRVNIYQNKIQTGVGTSTSSINCNKPVVLSLLNEMILLVS